MNNTGHSTVNLPNTQPISPLTELPPNIQLWYEQGWVYAIHLEFCYYCLKQSFLTRKQKILSTA